MLICITAKENTIDGEVDPRFGRCRYFLLIDTATMSTEAVENPGIGASGGAGVQAGQLMADREVKALLTGDVGPKARQTLEAAAIRVITGTTGKVKDALARFMAESPREKE